MPKLGNPFQTQAVYDAAELLLQLRLGRSNSSNVLGATLRLVAGQPAGVAANALSELRADLRGGDAAGDSSVAIVRAACQALADVYGPQTPVPIWRTAADARQAQHVARGTVKVTLPTELQSLREIAKLAKVVLRLAPNASEKQLLDSLRWHASMESTQDRLRVREMREDS